MGYFTDTILPSLHGGGYEGASRLHCFFILSGFFSSLLLIKRGPAWRKPSIFYFSRLIRLLPDYLIILVLSAAAYSWSGVSLPWTPTMKENLHESEFWYIICNIMALVPETFSLWGFTSDSSIFRFLLVSHAWSLSVDYAFIIVAPFILVCNRRLMAMTAFSFVVAIWLWHKGIYRNYAACSFVFFFAGAMSHRFYSYWLDHRIPKPFSRILVLILIAKIVLLTLFFRSISDYSSVPVAYLIYVLTFLLASPFIFWSSKTIVHDRWLGNLSYPIYLVHLPVIIILQGMGVSAASGVWIVLGICFSVAILLTRFVDAPLHRWRKNWG